MPSDDEEVQLGDKHVPSRSSKTKSTKPGHKRPKLGGLYNMFDIKCREGVDLAIAKDFFSRVGFLSMRPTSRILSKWFVQLMMDYGV